MKVAPTTYAGVKFRSRTEARWAFFFDSLDVEWRYEHEGFQLPSGWYVPDFWLPRYNQFLEIKGQNPTEVEIRKCVELHTMCLQDKSRPGGSVYLAIGDPADGSCLRMQFHTDDEYGEVNELVAPAVCYRCLKGSTFSFHDVRFKELAWSCCDYCWSGVTWTCPDCKVAWPEQHFYEFNGSTNACPKCTLGLDGPDSERVMACDVATTTESEFVEHAAALVKCRALEARNHRFWDPRGARP